MRILAAHSSSSGHTYAVVLNPIADGLGGLPARRCRLIQSSNPNWVREANTLMSLSRTKGIVVLQEFDYLEAWETHPTFARRRQRYIHEASQLASIPYPRSST